MKQNATKNIILEMWFSHIKKRESKKESIANNPTESGWYVCSVLTTSCLGFYNDADVTDCDRPADYLIANYEPRLLYWESNVWLVNPKSFETVDEKKIMNWTKVPDDYSQTVKIIGSHVR